MLRRFEKGEIITVCLPFERTPTNKTNLLVLGGSYAVDASGYEGHGNNTLLRADGTIKSMHRIYPGEEILVSYDIRGCTERTEMEETKNRTVVKEAIGYANDEIDNATAHVNEKEKINRTALKERTTKN